MTTISKEHKDFAAALVERATSQDLERIQHYYDACDDATWELAQELEKGKYSFDCLPDIAALFSDLLEAYNCGEVSARLYRAENDEEGNVSDWVEVNTWEEATEISVDSYGVNWTHPRCTRYETFASLILNRMLGCVDAYLIFSDERTDIDGDRQSFTLVK